MRIFYRLLTLTIAAFLSIAPLSLRAEPIVIELFTSQGCSSCPPSDAYLAELSKDPEILALAFHVDYWDRLGWPDTFASRDFTKRQYRYRERFNTRSVWTPQFVVEGQDYSKGNVRKMVSAYIEDARNRPDSVQLAIATKDERIRIRAKAVTRNLPQMDVIIVHFKEKETVEIRRGENAGRTLTYHNIVYATYDAGTWDGRATMDLTLALKDKAPLAVLVQESGNGRCVQRYCPGAARTCSANEALKSAVICSGVVAEIGSRNVTSQSIPLDARRAKAAIKGRSYLTAI